MTTPDPAVAADGPASPTRRSAGSIRKLPNGKFQARATVHGRQVGLGTYPSKRAAERALSEATVHPERIAARRSVVTVDDAAEVYFDHLLAGAGSDPKPLSTVAEYRRIFGARLAPAFGSRMVMSLRRNEVRAFTTALLRQRAPGTVRHAVTLLLRVTAFAAGNDLIPSDPLAGFQAPTAGKAKMTVLAWPQVEALMAALDSARPAGAHPAFAPGLATWVMVEGGALRVGELIALRVDDLDLDAGTLIIARAIRRGVERDPKTDAGSRVNVLSPDLLAALAPHVAGRPGSVPLFCSSKGGVIDPSNWLDLIHRACADAGLPRIRTHDLRHTAISLLLATGEPVVDVARWCGHENAATTLSVYAHAIPGNEDSPARAFASIRSGGNVRRLRVVAS